MLEKQVGEVLGKYQSLLSFEGRAAFIARCVRYGYTRDAEHVEQAAAYFEGRDLSEAGMVVGAGSRKVPLHCAIAPVFVKRRAYQGSEPVLECERVGRFEKAARVAWRQGDDTRMRMYSELDDFLECGPWPDYDEGLLFYAADILGDHENGRYLRDLGALLRSIRSRRRYDFA